MRNSATLVLAVLVCTPLLAGDWPQFRGRNCSGVAVNCDLLPAEIGPDKNVRWKVPLLSGHASPVLSGSRIYVTGERDGKLYTVALDRKDGRQLWEVEAPQQKLEQVHGIGSHAQSSPATDGERVISFFGSCGLFCYDTAGKQLWHLPMGPFNNDFGAGTSPIIEGDYVILCQDHDTDSFLTAIHKRTGKTVWRTDRSEFPRNYCTPVIWEFGGKKHIVVAATLRVVGYDFATGQELWTVRGISRAVCMTPVVGADNNLYVAGWWGGGDPGERIALDPFDQVVGPVDQNKNGALELEELTADAVKERMQPAKQRYSQIDRDKLGGISQQEWEYYRGLFDKSRNVTIAIQPGAVGEATSSHVLWEQMKFVPFCASPLHYNERVFTVKDGGIFCCLDAKTGAPRKQARLPATDSYYASPVAGDGKVYTVNADGKLTVVSAQDQWEVLHSAEFGEEVYATPALVDNRIYLRTKGQLYCMGQ